MSYTIGTKFSNILIDDVLHPILDQRIVGDNFKYILLTSNTMVNVPFSSEQLLEINDITKHLDDGCMIYCRSMGTLFIPVDNNNTDELTFVSPVNNNSQVYVLKLHIEGDNVVSGIINNVSIGGESVYITKDDYLAIKEGTIDPVQKIVISDVAMNLAAEVIGKNSNNIIVTTSDGYPMRQYHISDTTDYQDGVMMKYTSNNNESIYVVGKPPVYPIQAIGKGSIIASELDHLYITKQTFDEWAENVYTDSSEAKNFGDLLRDSKETVVYEVTEEEYGLLKIQTPIDVFTLTSNPTTSTLYIYEGEKGAYFKLDFNYGSCVGVYTIKNRKSKYVVPYSKNLATLDCEPGAEYIFTQTYVSGDVLNINHSTQRIHSPGTVSTRILQDHVIFTSPEAFTMVITNNHNIKHSWDGDGWYNGDTITSKFNFDIGSHVIMLHENSFVGGYDYTNINCEGTNITISGDLSAIFNPYANVFTGLFANCSAYVDASNLKFPKLNTVDNYYSEMFKNCINLKLPPTSLNCEEVRACHGMFSGCTSLLKTPHLPATILHGEAENVVGVYEDMFFNCTSLIEASVLPAKNVPVNAYSHMFEGCTSLVNPPIICGDSFDKNACAYMFKGCTSLGMLILNGDLTVGDSSFKQMCKDSGVKKCNNLYGTFGEEACANMFENCTSLLEAPEINLVSSGTGCCKEMFKGCTNLLKGYSISGTLSSGSCTSMFEGCGNMETFMGIYANDIPTQACKSMFKDCTSLVSCKQLTCNRIYNEGCESMFENCTSLVYPPALNVTVLTPYCCKSMFEGCISLKSPINLPATILPSGCYERMFYKCGSIEWSDSGKPYRIPSSGTASGTGWGTNMFSLNSGTLPEGSGTPLVNTTYYYK